MLASQIVGFAWGKTGLVFAPVARRWRAATGCLLASACCACLAAEPPLDPRSPSPATQRLASGTFDQRQRAMRELWADRDSNQAAVQLAVADPDPEISSRAEWVLERWRRGILVDTPAGAVRQLESGSLPDAVQKLLDLGQFAGAVVAIEEAIAAVDDVALSRASVALGRGFPFHVRLADQEGQLGELAELIDRLATTPDWIVSRNQFWRLLDAGSERWPEVGSRPGAGEAELWRGAAVALLAAGRHDEAISLVERLGGRELLWACQLLAGRWGELARGQVEAAEQAADRAERDRHWAYVLLAADRAGDRELRAKAVEELSSLGEGADRDELQGATQLRWQVLAMHGEIDAAVADLSRTQPLSAAEVLAQSGRLAEAFELLGWDPNATDRELAALVREARAAIESWQPTPREVPPQLDRLLAIARLLHQAGRRDAAWDLFRGAADSAGTAKPEAWAMARAFVMQAMLRLNRVDWLTDLVTLHETVALTNTDRYFLARPFDVRAETFDALLAGLSQLLPVSDQDALRTTMDFLAGQTPHGFDPIDDYRRLYDWLIGQGAARQGRPNRQAQRPVVRLNSDFARLFESHGQIELAKQARLDLASMGDQEAVLELAEAELQEGRGQSARGLFQAVWRRLDAERRQPDRLNLIDESAALAMRAMLGEAVAATRLGDDRGAEDLWRLIDLAMGGPSAKSRDSFAKLLIDQGFDERAEAICRDLLPGSLLGLTDQIDFYGVARNYHRAVLRRDPALAAELLDLGLVGTIETTPFYPAAYVSLPALVHRQRVLAMVTAGDIEQVRPQIDAIMRLNPIDIDFGEKAIKRFREVGWHSLADATMERIYQSGKRHLASFPLDVSTANNLAWILALSDHRLDEAEEWSWRTVWLTPDSSVYRDTLAEIWYRRGRTDDAIALAEACLLDQPGEWHIREQLRRFRGAENLK